MWLTLAPIIGKYGIEVAMRIWDLIRNDEPVTAERWAELKQLAAKSAQDYLDEARRNNPAGV